MHNQIGVMFRREQPAASLPAFARSIEEMGFDELWVVEDCFYHGGIAQAAIALASTERIKVGLGIAPAVARNSAFSAMEFATLANAYPGRFIAGIGHGVDVWMQQIGEKPASWMASMREIVTDIQALLRGETVTTTGEYSALDNVVLEFVPEQRPPLLLGVRGPKSVQLAGEIADGVLLAEAAGPDYIRWSAEQMRAGSGGEDRAVYTYANCLIDDANPQAAIEAMQAWMGEWSPEPGAKTPANIAPLHYANELMAEWTAGKPWQTEWLEDVNLCGNFADVCASLERMWAAGATSVILTPHPNTDTNSWLNSIAPLARRD